MQEYCGLVIQQEGEGDEYGHDSAVRFHFIKIENWLDPYTCSKMQLRV